MKMKWYRLTLGLLVYWSTGLLFSCLSFRLAAACQSSQWMVTHIPHGYGEDRLRRRTEPFRRRGIRSCHTTGGTTEPGLAPQNDVWLGRLCSLA